jgi:AMMECR1 domain-containing protein
MRFVDEPGLLAQLRPTRDGLIIEDGPHRALFLPAMWRYFSDPRQFLNNLRQKAGLEAEYWSPAFRASRFRTTEIRRQLSEPADQHRHR